MRRNVKDGFAGIPFGYQGGLHDSDSELLNLGAKYYNPKTGEELQFSTLYLPQD